MENEIVVKSEDGRMFTLLIVICIIGAEGLNVLKCCLKSFCTRLTFNRYMDLTKILCCILLPVILAEENVSQNVSTMCLFPSSKRHIVTSDFVFDFHVFNFDLMKKDTFPKYIRLLKFTCIINRNGILLQNV